MKKLTVFLMILVGSLIILSGCGVAVDYVDQLTLNGIQYSASYDQVITDEKMIDKQIGTISGAHFLKNGTQAFSLKNMDKNKAVAVKSNGKWLLYKAVSDNNSISKGNGIKEATYSATSLIVQKVGSEETQKIDNKEKIKKVLDGIKAGLETTTSVGSAEGNNYNFYFVIPDKEGIGQIAYKYNLIFQDINLKGYIRRYNDIYIVDSSISKIITEPFGVQETIYDSTLGGKQQIYNTITDGKLVLNKVVKETPEEKFKVTALKQGEDIWQNGNKVKDKLPGKYKVEIYLKDTKLQDKVLLQLSDKQVKLLGVVSINATSAEGGASSVIYLCYDKEPNFNFDESQDAFVLASVN